MSILTGPAQLGHGSSRFFEAGTPPPELPGRPVTLRTDLLTAAGRPPFVCPGTCGTCERKAFRPGDHFGKGVSVPARFGVPGAGKTAAPKLRGRYLLP
ncbi:hypothetical protein [Thermacetogenium phaeum]|nr:hypothetical protein [Thermacetogenium phaeum]